MRKSKENGFTLVELIVVIVIMAVLIGVTISGVYKYVNEARVSKTTSDCEVLKTAIMSMWGTKEGYEFEKYCLARCMEDERLIHRFVGSDTEYTLLGVIEWVAGYNKAQMLEGWRGTPEALAYLRHMYNTLIPDDYTGPSEGIILGYSGMCRPKGSNEPWSYWCEVVCLSMSGELIYPDEYPTVINLYVNGTQDPNYPH